MRPLLGQSSSQLQGLHVLSDNPEKEIQNTTTKGIQQNPIPRQMNNTAQQGMINQNKQPVILRQPIAQQQPGWDIYIRKVTFHK